MRGTCVMTAARTGRRCTVPKCGKVVAKDALMCADCWRLVPLTVQEVVALSFRPEFLEGKATPEWRHAVSMAVKAVARMKGSVYKVDRTQPGSRIIDGDAEPEEEEDHAGDY